MKELKVAERIFRKRKTSSYAISGYKIDQCDTRFFIEPTSKMLSFSCQMHSWRSRVWYKHPRYQNPFLFFMLLSFHMIEKKCKNFWTTLSFHSETFWFLSQNEYWVLQILILSKCFIMQTETKIFQDNLWRKKLKYYRKLHQYEK